MTHRLLLDTCAIIWIALNEPIRPEAKTAINTAAAVDEKIRVSPISAWELGLLSANGRLAAAKSPTSIFGEVIATPGIKVEALSPGLLIESSFLPGSLHGDPADRILIATARAFDLTLVTRDQSILDYARAGHVRALAC
ncbi:MULTISPECIES: type II toxin-antitoxin system VapC family toxin [unclassified Mesorhizobium]|uniref:type II toxin-antitoxin system VapC family toxin n=1 Tax=unclassified Mesorhizobium TaxID=325217 RepID=UPI00112BF7DE|nr:MULTISPECIES: type II toxin-antitoxin system VapC family toxin [unclassified Mesorhizobium]TPJ47289.1 type II toxin-antitoxin system VapC family toxin [Mesorhizobium sp. B2-6-6]TPJ53408.1 type II toxin-antitoxin system VapC family toxin [Mesorhizobium sp. B2-6-4]TPM97036.1 type II toxin-antitoxin system VapC family toxin [Mesorhizobium sp. B2-1-5]MBZ9897908.1 type II toxin-antitoxin system VapC family toxin [Mesorhizobium sp. BR1-1-6]MBZ9920658.1 type II toxin-antitoxin system VapC family t